MIKKRMKAVAAGIAALCSSSAAVAAEKSDFFLVSLHTGWTTLFDLFQGGPWLILMGFGALAAVIAFRLSNRKSHH